MDSSMSTSPVSGSKRTTKLSSPPSKGMNRMAVRVHCLPANARVSDPKRWEPAGLSPQRQVGALVGVGVVVVVAHRALEKALAIQDAFIDFQEGQAEECRFDVMAIIFPCLVHENKARRQPDSERANPAVPGDDDRFDDGDLVAVDRPVKALHRRWQALRQRDGFNFSLRKAC